MTINSMTNNFRSPPIQLAEATAVEPFPKEVQLLKIGNFSDPRYGKFPVTSKMLTEMVSNFKKGIRGIKPAIDFKHESDAEAAAWIADLFTKNNDTELWATPDWTGEGQRKLSDRVYGYLSADFNQKYVDNEKGEQHGCVLLGAALTNRPVIKNMQPVIQLSEGDSMSFKKLSEAKKLADLSPEDLEKVSSLMEELGASSVEDFIAKIAALKQAPKPEPKPSTEAPKEMQEMEKQLSEKNTKLTAAEAELKTLKEEKVVAEKEKTFNKMLSEGKAIPAQKDAFIAGDLMKFAELAPKGGVKLSENGTEGGNGNDANTDDDDKVLKLAEEKVKSKEAKDMPTAISMVLKEQKEAK